MKQENMMYLILEDRYVRVVDRLPEGCMLPHREVKEHVDIEMGLLLKSVYRDPNDRRFINRDLIVGDRVRIRNKFVNRVESCYEGSNGVLVLRYDRNIELNIKDVLECCREFMRVDKIDGNNITVTCKGKTYVFDRELLIIKNDVR